MPLPSGLGERLVVQEKVITSYSQIRINQFPIQEKDVYSLSLKLILKRKRSFNNRGE
jgi:hypothetical protein